MGISWQKSAGCVTRPTANGESRLNHLRLSTKLWLIVGLTWFVGCGIATVLFFRVSGVAAAYDTLLNTQYEQRAKARVLQLSLKKQVQEWKDLLLRGSDPAALQKYSQDYRREAAGIRASARELSKSVTNPEVKALL